MSLEIGELEDDDEFEADFEVDSSDEDPEEDGF